MRDLLAVIFRRKWLILGIFGVTTLLVGVKEFSSPTSWSADATLLLNRQNARASVLERSGRVLPWTEVIESEIEVVRSAPVLQRARERLAAPTSDHPDGIRLNPRQIGKKISTGIIGESNVLFVSGSDGDPKIAVAVTNAVAESYVEFHRELHQLPDASALIQAKADSAMVQLEAAEMERSILLAKIGVSDTHEEERALVGQRERLRISLSDTERALARIEVELDAARQFLAGEIQTLPFYANTGSVHGNALMASHNAVVRARGELQVMQDKYTDEHPMVQSAASELEALESELRDRTRAVVGTREHERLALIGEREELRTQINKISGSLAALPAVMREVDVLNTRIKALSNQYTTLSNEVVNSEINRSSFTDYSVKILSPALTAEQGGRGDLVKLFLAPILALMVGIGLAFYMENLDHSISNREDVERHVNIPVLASFPETRVGEFGSRTSGSFGPASIPFRRRGSGRL
jgi:uncharacterized protein involved in exopolysaccharide biosynthesis